MGKWSAWVCVGVLASVPFACAEGQGESAYPGPAGQSGGSTTTSTPTPTPTTTTTTTTTTSSTSTPSGTTSSTTVGPDAPPPCLDDDRKGTGDAPPPAPPNDCKEETPGSGAGGAGATADDDASDDEAQAEYLGCMDDDDDARTVSGVINGNDDEDWYVFWGRDDTYANAGPYRTRFPQADNGLTICGYYACAPGGTLSVNCPGLSQDATSPINGYTGCCVDAPSQTLNVEGQNFKCTFLGSGDDHALVFFRVKPGPTTPTNACVPYTVTYHF